MPIVSLASPVYISFGGHSIAFFSNAPEVNEFVSNFYARLLSPVPGRLAGEISVVLDAGFYEVRGTRAQLVAQDGGRGVEHRIKREVLLSFMAVHSNLLWMHAAAVTRAGGAIMMAGEWGSGKSTLTARLCHAGWQYLTDDTAPIDPATDRVLPFPQTPLMRPASRVPLSPAELSGLEKVAIPLAPASWVTEPVPIEAIVFPRYTPGIAARLDPITPADAVFAMVPHILNFPGHRQQALEYLARLVRSRALLRLPFCTASEAASLLLDRFGRSS